MVGSGFLLGMMIIEQVIGGRPEHLLRRGQERMLKSTRKKKVLLRGGIAMNSVRRIQCRNRGFSMFELLVAMFIVMILVAVVILLVTGFFGEASETAWETDLRIMKSSFDSYATQAFEYPTADGRLPLPGEYALIDFDASFKSEGKELSFYPHFISKLPKHWDEGVWRVDSAGLVSVDMEKEEY